MTTTPDTELVPTRNALHQVAEHLLGAARKRATGQITLLSVPGGVGTPELPDGTSLAMVGTDLVVRRAGRESRTPLTTIAEAAAFAGVTPGFPWTKHPPATPFLPDEPLVINAGAAAALARWFAIGEEALTTLAHELAAEEPSRPQIFPEHFDLGVTAGRVNYGFSPGDVNITQPYAYVGPHDGPPVGDSFWNAPFGAYRTWDDISTAEQARAFLRSGHDALGL